jgi:tetratricopeptide (TPR) repeat protein
MANDPPFAKARTLWKSGRHGEALREYSRLLREHPLDVRVLLEAARAYGARREANRCLALLEKAVRLGARRPEVLHAAGETYARLSRWKQAESCFRRAVRLTDLPQPRLELAKICERRHLLDEASELVAQALVKSPQSFDARLLSARIERRQGRSDRALAALDSLSTAAGLPAAARSEAFGALAELFDEQGDYSAAWEAILRCKELAREGEEAAWRAAQFVTRRFQRMTEELTADQVARWQATPLGPPPRRVALLAGFPRSGTTLLEQVLDAHPQVVATEEDDYFGAEVVPLLGKGRPDDFPVVELLETLDGDQLSEARAMALNAYQALHDEPLEPLVHIDKNPAMMQLVPVMRRVFPELKLLVALRDPRDVVLSCFLRQLPVNPVSVWFHTLERTVDRYLIEMGGWLQLRQFYDAVELRYEDAVSDLRSVAQRALSGLDLPWDDSILNYRERSGEKFVGSPTYAAVAKPIYATSRGRWRNYQAQLEGQLARLQPLVKTLGYD